MTNTELYKHQKEALRLTESQNKCAYYLDMGLGKTYVGAEKMIHLNSKVNLLICQKSKVDDWVEHFIENYAGQTRIYNLTQKKSAELFWKEINDNNVFPEMKTAVINYELAWRRRELLNVKDFTLMLDESSLIQNRKAKQSKFILKLQPKNVILLSGTPTAGKYENLWTQAHLLGWSISEGLYNRQYINWKLIDIGGGMKAKTVNKDDPYKNVDRLKTKFREHGAIFMKTEDVLELPEQNFIDVKVPKSKDYKKFMKDSILSVEGDELIGDTSLTKRLYAREICGQYSKEKLEAFRDLLESTNDRLIVFYNFTAELNALTNIVSAEMGNKHVSIVNGEMKSLMAYETCDDSVTFVQYQAGAMGLNLQKANKVIYYSLPERSELFEQSKKRIHRIGQEQSCFYYVMMCSGTIEEDIYSALKMRKDYTDELFKEGEKNG